MTLLQLFNEKLSQLPEMSQRLEEQIIDARWSKKRKKHACIIVRQLKNENLIRKDIFANYVLFTQLKINLSFAECGVNDDRESRMAKASKYIEKLLKDLNAKSSEIKFSFGGHIENDGNIEFLINWEF